MGHGKDASRRIVIHDEAESTQGRARVVQLPFPSREALPQASGSCLNERSAGGVRADLDKLTRRWARR